MQKHFDVVISGGGLSGTLMALSLSSCKYKDGTALSIAIIEANPIHQDASLSFDDRVLALSHGTAAYLNHVGVWQHLESNAQPIETIHISDRGHYGKARIKAEDHQVAALGYVAKMSDIGKCLLTELSTKNNITWFAPDTIDGIEWQQEQVNIRLTSEQLITTPLLLGCDGAKSACRQFANIDSQTIAYEQSALIANVACSLPHNNIAYERFTQTGPIAMLPLSPLSQNKAQGHCSLVWTLTHELAHQYSQLDDNAFKKELNNAFGHWLGEITKVGKRDIYPLNLVQAKEQVYHRMVLIGNASHTIHPIAGQGFNLGVRDVEQLTQVITQALSIGQDIGQFSLLSDYAVTRKTDHNAVITLTDSLVTLFSNDLFPLVVGRNIGLKVLNYVTPFKKAFVSKTMGY